MQLDKAIETRHSARSFKTSTPNWRKIIKAIDAARLAPLAGNVNCMKFVVVSDKEVISQLATACQQKHVGQVKYIVVVCTKLSELINAYDKRAERYARQQAGAAIENFLLKLNDLGLATCWTGAFADNQVKSILKIPDKEKDKVNIEAIFPIGKELRKSKQRAKPPLDTILYFNKWKNEYMIPLRKPEAF